MILLREAGHKVVQKDLQGSGEVGLIIQVTGSGGEGGSPNNSRRTHIVPIADCPKFRNNKKVLVPCSTELPQI